jgi:hypothetical protein
MPLTERVARRKHRFPFVSILFHSIPFVYKHLRFATSRKTNGLPIDRTVTRSQSHPALADNLRTIEHGDAAQLIEGSDVFVARSARPGRT